MAVALFLSGCPTPTSNGPTDGSAAKLVFTTQPTTATSTAAISPAITVEIEDAQGNRVTSSTALVSLAIGTNPALGTLLGSKPVNAVAGVATFSGAGIDKAGKGYTLSATSSGLSSATSSSFDINVGAATKLLFAVQPVSTKSATTMPSVVVDVTDAGGNVITSSTATVTMTIGTNPVGGTLRGGTPGVSAVAGVATFSSLLIVGVGTGYTLAASSSGLTSATSASFDIQ